MKEETESNSTELSEDEGRLIRLFRCMDIEDQGETLVEASHRLMRKFSVDPHLGKFRSAEDTLRDELSPENLENFDERIFSAWPGDWPGRKIVDLDNVGDASFFLKEKMEEGVSYYILGSSKNDSSNAEYLAEMYLEDISGQGFPRYRDFCEPEENIEEADEQEKEDTITDFKGFLKTWRERVIATIEKQALRRKAD